MISFDVFINKWLGKKIDWDGFFQGQCMDLYHQYVHEVLGLEHPSAPTAAGLWKKTYKDYEKINNTPTGIPGYGDIVVWNRNVGAGAGHVAVFIAGNVNSFVSLDQNWPTLSKVTKTSHDYRNVFGWLHPLGNTMPDDPINRLLNKYKIKTIDELDRKIEEHVGIDWNGGFLGADRNRVRKLESLLRQIEQLAKI